MIRWAFAALAVLSGLGAQESPRPEDRRVVLTLEDGSRFKALLSGETIVVKTAYGDQTIPVREVRSIRRVDERQFLVRTSRISLQGEIAPAELEGDTEFGKVKIPIREIRTVGAGGGPLFFGDDETVALWSFEGDSGRDSVKERELTLKEMRIESDSEGPAALTRITEKGYAEAPADESLSFPDGTFTIEARFKVGSTSQGYVTIVAKNNATDAQIRNYCLLVQNSGQLYVDSLGQGISTIASTPNPVVKLNQWAYVAVVFDAKNGAITYYVDGKQVHVHQQAVKIAANDGPIYLGASPPAHGWSGPPERIQFVRLSRGTRTAEEIAEMQQAIEGGASLAWKGGGRGLALRSGGFLAADFPGLAGATFRTKLGELKLSEKAAGRISLYVHREADLEQLAKTIRDLIQDLGEPRIEDREAAQTKLVKIGGPAIPLLEKGREEADAEVRTRIDWILKKFEENGVARQPIADVLRMGKTVLYGWLETDRVRAASRCGTFDVPIRDIATVQLGEAKTEGAQLLRLRSGETVQGFPPQGAALEVETEFGTMKIPYADVTSLTFDATAKSWTVKTAHMSIAGGVVADRIDLETPAGTIGVPMGEVVEFGISVSEPKSADPGPVHPQPPQILRKKG